jgi:hypothetical protein
MTRENESHYGKKHPAGTTPDARIANAVRSRASEGRLACTVAFQIAQELSVQSVEVGRTADLLEVRIIKCQLGLFGYDPPKRIVNPAPSVDPLLGKAIHAGLVNDRLPCATAFSLAERFSIPRMTVSSACETLGIRVTACQLGAF